VRTECAVLGGGYLTCIGKKEGWVIVGNGGGRGHERVASLRKVVEERLPDLPISSVSLMRSYARRFRASTFFAGHFSAAIFAGVDTCKNRRLREQWKEDDDVRKKVLSDECRERAPTRATIKKQQKLPLPMNFELFPCFALTHHEKPHSSAGVRTGRI
jgi:hypothetical protein